MMIAYTVSCRFESQQVADDWVHWLCDEHIADVMAAGASGADIVRLEDGKGAIEYEVRYRFASREVFEAYIRDHAPALREEGLRRFPLALGLSYSRSVGEIVYSSG